MSVYILSAIPIAQSDLTFQVSAVEASTGTMRSLVAAGYSYPLKWTAIVGDLSAYDINTTYMETVSGYILQGTMAGTQFSYDLNYNLTTGIDYISGWTTDDKTNISFALSAGSNFTSVSADVFDFYPYSPTVVTETISNTEISAVAHLGDINDNYQDFIPTELIGWFTDSTTEISAVNNNDSSTYYWNTLSAANLVSSINISTDDGSYSSFVITLCSEQLYRTPDSFVFNANPNMQYLFDPDQTTNITVVASAYYQRNEKERLDDATVLMWYIDPVPTLVNCPTGVVLVGSDGWTNPGPATDLEWIQFTASDYSQTFTIKVSSIATDIGGWAGDQFIPYLALSGGASFYITVSAISPYGSSNQYLVHAYAQQSGIIHNIDPSYGIAWDYHNSLSGVNAYLTDGSVLPFYKDQQRFQSNRFANPIIIEVTFPTWDQISQLQSYTYNFSVSANESAGNGVNPSTSSMVDNFRITGFDYIPDSVFVPDFSINNETSTAYDLYRLSASSFVCTISNQSTIPAGTILNSQFLIGINDDISFIEDATFTSVASTFNTIYTATTSVGMTATLQMSNWPSPITKIAPLKDIHFVTGFPQASSFMIWPDRYWDNSTPDFVQINDPITESPGVCAYGFCHTETFHFSATEITTYSGEVYYWSIEAYNPQPLNSTSAYVTADIPTNSSTITLPVSLAIYTDELPIGMPTTYYDDVSGSYLFYPNFAQTVSGDRLRGPIYRPSISDTVNARIIWTNDLDLSGHSLPLPTDTPLSIGTVNLYTWTISTSAWSYSVSDVIPTYTVNLTVVPIPSAINTISYLHPETIRIQLDISTSFTSKVSTVNDWCNETMVYATSAILLTAYPIRPIVYTSNRYSLTGDDVQYQCVVTDSPQLSGFVWNDSVFTTGSSFITSYNNAQRGSLSIKSVLVDGNTDELLNENLNYIINSFTPYNSAYARVYGATELVLPQSLYYCQIPPNEWTTYSNINRSFDKLKEDLDYISENCKMYNQPPTEYFGWLGSINEPGDIPRFHWHVNISQLDTYYAAANNAISDIFTDLKDVAATNVSGIGDILVVSNGTSVSILSSDFGSSIIDSISYKGIGDDFINIVAVDVDKKFDIDPRIYTLDSIKNRIIVFEYNFDTFDWNILYDWGGLGGINARTKFRTPTDLLVDADNNVWVVDSGNLGIKKFVKNGNWLQTITSPHWTTSNAPLSIAIADNGDLHVLSTSNILKFSADGSFIGYYTIPELNGKVVKSITTSKDGGFFYIVCTDRIIKITQTGLYVGTFANDLGIVGMTNCFHDDHRNLLIASPKALLKYVDRLELLNTRLDTDSLMWPMSAIHIDPDEYVQDWVINKGFARFWDNIELMRRSIYGKFGYKTLTTGEKIPVIISFSPDEYVSLPYSKGEIYLGVNELNVCDVYNRCIGKLYECIETLLELIT